jgi:nicotinate phosphoribosyltransferase
VRDGELLPGSLPPLSEIWEFAQQNLRELPDRYHALRDPPCYPVDFSEGVRQLRAEAISHYGGPKEEGAAPG